jgi:M6 family metalloprotease-like protein
MRCALVLCILAAGTAARADYMDHFVVRDDVGLRKSPSIGPAKLLLLPVEVAGFPPFDRAVLEQFYGPASGGFVDYYVTASLGRFQPSVAVGPTITFGSCPLDETKFPGCAVPRGDPNSLAAGIDFVREVLRRADEAGVDFSAYDVNGRRGTPDGWVDGVMLLMNTPFGGVAFPFAYFNQGDDLAGGTGGAAKLDGVKIPLVALAGDSDSRVMIHEFGHLLGLTDLYDESSRYAGLYLSWMGAWGYGPDIPLPDAESRFRLRWGNWHQVQGKETVVIRPADRTGDLVRVGTGDEYFLVENRGPGRYDTDLAARGLAVYHVDRRVKLDGREGTFFNRLIDCVQCDPFHPYIRLQQADGLLDIELGGAFNAEEDLFRPGDIFEGDAASFYSGAPSGFRLADIQLLEDGSIRATVEAPAEGQCGESLCESGEGCVPASCGQQPQPGPLGCGAVSGESALAAMCWALLHRRARRQRSGARQGEQLAGSHREGVGVPASIRG